MIRERTGDLLTEKDLTHIAHQANLYHTFGAGLALQIARKFPYAENADKKTKHGFLGKLGCFSVGSGDGPTVLNLYTQEGMGTHYHAMRCAMDGVEDFLRSGAPKVRLGIPYRLGCGLAGGSWPRVYGIIEAVFGKSSVEVVIVRLPEDL